MDNLNELKQIWLSADTTTLPGAAEMVRIIKKYRSAALVKKCALIATALLLAAIMVAVVFLYKSAMITTRAGEAFMLSACIMLIVTNITSLGRLYRVKDHSNKEFMSYLEQVQANRLRYYQHTQVWGLLLASAGLLLYIYEAVHATLSLAIIAYTLVIIYIAVMWLIMRPRAYKRQAKKLEETIKKVKSLANQF